MAAQILNMLQIVQILRLAIALMTQKIVSILRNVLILQIALILVVLITSQAKLVGIQSARIHKIALTGKVVSIQAVTIKSYAQITCLAQMMDAAMSIVWILEHLLFRAQQLRQTVVAGA